MVAEQNGEKLPEGAGISGAAFQARPGIACGRIGAPVEVFQRGLEIARFSVEPQKSIEIDDDLASLVVAPDFVGMFKGCRVGRADPS